MLQHLSDQRIKEIAERLEAATDAPWRTDEYLELSGPIHILAGPSELDFDGELVAEVFCGGNSEPGPNAALIVNAPCDLKLLLDEVRRLQRKK